MMKYWERDENEKQTEKLLLFITNCDRNKRKKIRKEKQIIQENSENA